MAGCRSCGSPPSFLRAFSRKSSVRSRPGLLALHRCHERALNEDPNAGDEEEEQGDVGDGFDLVSGDGRQQQNTNRDQKRA